ncbi:hypothetical protein ACX801_07885 [Arthrobacter bambusae]
MADRSHLTPVTTTDRRGRTTTVYRKPGLKDAAPAGRLPAATIFLAAAPAGSPLPPVRARGSADLLSSAFARDVLAGTGVHPTLWVAAPEASSVASLAMELTETGALPAKVASLLLGYSAGHRNTGFAHDALRIAAHIWPRRTDTDSGWARKLIDAAAGPHEHFSSGQSFITTAEELERSAAVAEFLVRATNHSLYRFGDTLGLPVSLPCKRFLNRDLEQLVRERPADIDRIISYTAERGMDPDSSEAVDELREWLDSDTPSLGDGWL